MPHMVSASTTPAEKHNASLHHRKHPLFIVIAGSFVMEEAQRGVHCTCRD